FFTYLCCSYLVVFFFFFFSSRRRHTRFSRDWSSDVCSSDLWPAPGSLFQHSSHRSKQLNENFVLSSWVPLCASVHTGTRRRAACRCHRGRGQVADARVIRYVPRQMTVLDRPKPERLSFDARV